MSALALRLDDAQFEALTLPRQLLHRSPNHRVHSLHVVAPSLHPKDDAEGVSMRWGRDQQSSGTSDDRIPSRDEVRDAIKSAFSKCLPQYRITAQEIADKIGARDGTVEGWRAKPGLMSAEYLVILMIAFPEFGSEVRRRLRLRPELAPTLRSVLDELEEKLAGGML